MIDTNEKLAALCARLEQSPFVAVDTEFIRERTYWPELCLIQIADENGFCKEACPNDTEITSTCVCGGTTHTNQFNAKICCDADHSWDETAETCV